MRVVRIGERFARRGSRRWLSPGGSTLGLAIVGALFVAATALPAQGQVLPGLNLDFAGEFELDPEGNVPGNLVALFMASPIVNGLNLALLLLAVAMYLYFFATINSRRMAPAEFVDEITKLAVRGNHEAASDLCRAHRRVFISRIIQRCVDNAGKRHSVIMDMLDAEGRRRADVVWNRLSYLADVANLAPLLGLLGTVMGMIQVFFGLGHEEAAAGAAVVSRGVAEAMATTLFGFAVGIVALILYSLSKARFTRTLAEAEAAVHSVTDHMKRDMD